MSSASQFNLAWWIIGYTGLLMGIIAAMFWQRQQVMREYSTPAALAQWKAWRQDVQKEQANPGPVTRRVPKSIEPPALVLMRDYFVVSLVGAVFFPSLLYWIIAWFVTGALHGEYQINS